MIRRARLLLPLVVLALVAGTAFTALNTVAASKASETLHAVTISQLRPTQCAALTLTRILVGAGAISDPNGNASLILGSAGVDTVTARDLSDCVVGGAGNDSINGGAGTDVCIGGPGTDTFSGCETSYQ